MLKDEVASSSNLKLLDAGSLRKYYTAEFCLILLDFDRLVEVKIKILLVR